MTGTDLCVNKPHQSRSYLNHLVFIKKIQVLNVLNMVFTLHFFLFKMQFVS